MVQNWFRGRSEIYIYISIHLLGSELGLPICCLLLAIRAISRCDFVSTFSHIEKIPTFQTLKSKIDELTDMIDFGEYPSFSLESLSFVTSMQYVCIFTKKINQVQVWMNYDIDRIFTKNNLSGDRLPSTLGALIALIFFHFCLIFCWTIFLYLSKI